MAWDIPFGYKEMWHRWFMTPPQTLRQIHKEKILGDIPFIVNQPGQYVLSFQQIRQRAGFNSNAPSFGENRPVLCNFILSSWWKWEEVKQRTHWIFMWRWGGSSQIWFCARQKRPEEVVIKNGMGGVVGVLLIFSKKGDRLMNRLRHCGTHWPNWLVIGR